MSGIASKRSNNERLGTCYAALCAVTLGASVLLMGRATLDTAVRAVHVSRSSSSAIHTPPLISGGGAGDFDPRFGPWSRPPTPRPHSAVDVPSVRGSLAP